MAYISIKLLRISYNRPFNSTDSGWMLSVSTIKSTHNKYGETN